MAGRPTKLTPETQDRIVNAIRVGATYELAAQFGGISYSTFNNWMARGRTEVERRDNPRVQEGSSQWNAEQPYVEFLEAIKGAEGDAAIKWLALIDKAAADTWQAAAWKLERRYPKDYGRQIIQAAGTGDDGEPVPIAILGMSTKGL
jgi:hypothetical protein